MQIFSLRPALVRLVSSFFTDVLGAGYVSRSDKELLCVVTSYAGRCRYRLEAHTMFLQAAGMPHATVRAVADGLDWSAHRSTAHPGRVDRR
ncbi:MAG: carboxymuconolactone decarboxylase family protein [Candidatus Eremiobacteraeota bacterium]|nr:carboxymuconolactone decarboxylase family protein [Candidatus Eremiobacteraeota bacterium]